MLFKINQISTTYFYIKKKVKSFYIELSKGEIHERKSLDFFIFRTWEFCFIT